MRTWATRPDVGRVGVALVGFGAAGRQHAATLAAIDGAELRGVLDLDPAARIPAGTARYASWEQLLDDPSVRLVSLCTPPGGRTAAARAVLESGRAVLVEMPAATTTAELDSLAAVSHRTGQPAGVMFQHRFRLPDDVLDWTWQPSTTAVLEVSGYRPADYFRRTDWRKDPARALGGITAHLGAHYLDLACQLLGEPAEIHLARTREVVPGIESRAAGVVGFTGGATLSFAVTSESATRTERLTVMDVNQSLLIEDGRIRSDRDGVLTDHPAAPAERLHTEVYEEMLRAVTTGRTLRRCHLTGARAVTMILESVSGRLEPGP